MKLKFIKSQSLTHQASDSWIYRVCIYAAKRSRLEEERLLKRAIDAEASGKVISANRYRRSAKRQGRSAAESERIAAECMQLATRPESTRSSEQASMTGATPAAVAARDAITEESGAASWLELFDGLGETGG